MQDIIGAWHRDAVVDVDVFVSDDPAFATGIGARMFHLAGNRPLIIGHASLVG
jgi:hypothetical protein